MLLTRPRVRAVQGLGTVRDVGVPAMDDGRAPAPPKVQAAPVAPKKKARPLNDEAGLDKAYSSDSNLFLDDAGTLFVAGTKGGLTGKEWIENYAVFGPPLVANALGVKAPYPIEQHGRYSELEKFMEDHPGQVKNLVGHSKGSAVVHKYMQKHPEFKGSSRLYATPYEDVAGLENVGRAMIDFNKARGAMSEAGLGEKRDPFEKYILEGAIAKVSDLFGGSNIVEKEKRIANVGDPAALLDSSAERYDIGPDAAVKNLAGAGPHTYRDGVARFNAGFEENPIGPDRPGDIDPNYGAPPA